jgi:poly(hydroxyalkanoate) depolymerase family esterase
VLAVPALGLMWGLNWVAVRVALDEIPPWTLRAAGLGCGAFVLLVLALLRGRPLAVRRDQVGRLFVSGLLTVAGFNILVTFAQLYATTSRAAIVTYTMPVWAVLFAWIALGERPDRRRWTALVLGAAGLALLALPLVAAGRFSVGLVFALGAGVSWAAGTVFLKRYPIDGAPLAVAAWQLAVGAGVAIAGMLAAEGLPRWSAPGAAVGIAFGYHVVIAMAAAYFLWFEVVARLPAGVAALGVLMVPVVGVLGATTLLGERPSAADLAGFALVLAAASLSLLPAKGDDRRGALAFLRRHAGSEPAAAGRFETGGKSALRGFVTTAPWVFPRRRYLVYLPRGLTRREVGRAPLLVLIHGCRQTPEVIASATRIAALADRLGCLVLLPRQKRSANRWGCWNWFEMATARGWGETAIVAAQIRAVRRRYGLGRRRVVVAGLSSGAGLAAILGIRRPDLVAGVFAHSGVACGAATSPFGAFEVLRSGAAGDVVGIGEVARARADPAALPVRLLAVHGGRDEVVAPVNARELVRQYLAFAGHPAARAGPPADLPPPDAGATQVLGERRVTTSDWQRDGAVLARFVDVDALGHAWSGGDAQYDYADPAPPDATALLGDFLRGYFPASTDSRDSSRAVSASAAAVSSAGTASD